MQIHVIIDIFKLNTSKVFSFLITTGKSFLELRINFFLNASLIND